MDIRSITRTFLAVFVVLGADVRAAEVTAAPPSIQTLLKPAVLKKILEDRDIATSASLEDKRYSFHAAMLVKSSLSHTYRILTDYAVYARIVPYIDTARYAKESKILHLEGGIWKFRLISQIRFEEKGALSEERRQVSYEVVGGHFKGLTGEILMESRGERGTLVCFRGAQAGENWPPKFVIERGAEIVFGFTAKRMRSYVEEDLKKELVEPNLEKESQKHDDKIPRPRSRLPQQ